MTVETKKILDPKIKVHGTCVRVPVFVGHSEAVNHRVRAAEIERSTRRARILRGGAWRPRDRPARDGGYMTPKEVRRRGRPCSSAASARTRRSRTASMWVVSDNLRKGAALNAVQIAEELIKGYI
jgi:aspartate-semialdehyde dehydrogenase